jgi:hypothetical protein
LHEHRWGFACICVRICIVQWCVYMIKISIMLCRGRPDGWTWLPTCYDAVCSLPSTPL